MSKQIPFEMVLEKAHQYKAEMSQFLRDMIAIPSESSDEKRVVLRIKEEMEKVGFDRVEIDPMGNVLGYIGHGPHLIAMDAHIDTVGVGNMANWTFDPYEGMEDHEIIGGRGASDQEGGMASMVYAGKIIKDLGLEDQYTLLVTGTVQEEDCDGLCWQYIIEQSQIRPEFVVSTEPTDCQIYRGQRGRMEIRVEVQALSQHLGYDDFLGKGTDPKTGVVRNPNLLDYKFPTMLDLPELECDFVQTFEPQSVYGHKSLGEPPIISPGPAIRNAIRMATGVAINELPITPKTLFREFVQAGLITEGSSEEQRHV